MNDLIRNGTKLFYTLDGDRDHDRFLEKSDMSKSHWELLKSCFHQGPCDSDVAQAMEYFEISDYQKALDSLVSLGLEKEKFEDEEFNLNEDEILRYYLWSIAGDIFELDEEEE